MDKEDGGVGSAHTTRGLVAGGLKQAGGTDWFHELCRQSFDSALDFEAASSRCTCRHSSGLWSNTIQTASGTVDQPGRASARYNS